ncbi:MAG: RHS repeat domain-containing protein, partial [Gemmatimonadaceae bacterium]
MNLTPGSSQYVYFTLSNYTWYDDYWEVMPSCDGAAVTSCGPSYASVLVPAMSSVSYGVLTTTSSTPGTGWLAIQAYTGGTSASLFSSLTVSVSNPGASPLTLDVSYSNNSYQSPVLCAAACFAVTHAQSTVPFFSFDSPNSVTLVYNGDRAYPRPFVYGDVIFGPTSPAVSEYWLDVQVNGAPASFVNGNSGRIYFQGSSSSVRLGGQIDATGMATGVYPMTITVTAVRAGGNEVLSRQTELMVANESGSAVAAGWSIAGVQRLYFPAVGGYMIAEGDGTAVRLTGLGAYATDFSYLTFDGTYYTRNYSDGVRAVFNQSGLHVYTTDRTGRRISFAYSGSQLVTVEGSARYLGMAAPYHSLAYGGSGLASITEVSQGGPNRVTSITVDGSRKLTRITDPDAYYTQFGYDGYGRLSAATDRRGGTTEYVYHASWKLNQVILPQIPMDAGGGGTTPANPIASFWPWQREGVPTGYTSTSNPAQPAGLYGIQ